MITTHGASVLKLRGSLVASTGGQVPGGAAAGAACGAAGVCGGAAVCALSTDPDTMDTNAATLPMTITRRLAAGRNPDKDIASSCPVTPQAFEPWDTYGLHPSEESPTLPYLPTSAARQSRRPRTFLAESDVSATRRKPKGSH